MKCGINHFGFLCMNAGRPRRSVARALHGYCPCACAHIRPMGRTATETTQGSPMTIAIYAIWRADLEGIAPPKESA